MVVRHEGKSGVLCVSYFGFSHLTKFPQIGRKLSKEKHSPDGFFLFPGLFSIFLFFHAIESFSRFSPVTLSPGTSVFARFRITTTPFAYYLIENQ